MRLCILFVTYAASEVTKWLARCSSSIIKNNGRNCKHPVKFLISGPFNSVQFRSVSFNSNFWQNLPKTEEMFEEL